MSLSQNAYTEIRHRIVTLALAPGTLVSEAELRDALNIGRTPIREALQRLAREKLVTIVPRRGVFVTDVDLTDLSRLFEVRAPLEALACRLAATRGTAADWERMERWFDLLDDPARAMSLIDIDHQCHRAIYAAADNPYLADTLSIYYVLSLRLWHYALPEIHDLRAALDEHRAIAHALRAGDGARAGTLMTDHIQSFQREIATALVGRLAR